MVRSLFVFLLTAVIPVIMVSCSNKNISSSPSSVEGVTEFIDLFVADEVPDVNCYRIPALLTAANGDLIAAIDERVPGCADLRGSRDINIAIRRSTDRGDTWSDPEVIVDFPDGQSASDASMVLDQVTGEIFMFYNFMDLDQEPDVYYLHVIRSKDHGKTWSEPEDITSQIAPPDWHNDFKFITSGRGIQTRGGKIQHTLVNLKKGLHLFGSDDHGKTWYRIDTPVTPADESKIAELDDGRWMINSRVNNPGYRYIHVSDDEGKSWKSHAAHELTDPGNNGSFIRYTSLRNGDDKNRLLFANTRSEDQRENLTVRISYDEGETWSEGKTIYEGSAAYSSLTILDNGDIGLFFERDEYTKNTFVRFSLEWLTDGQDTFQR